MSAVGLAERTRLDVSDVATVLEDLTALGLARPEDAGYALTARVLRLGEAYLSSMRLTEVAKPHLERLTTDTGESTSAAVLDDTEVVYVARIPATTEAREAAISVGTRVPAHASSMGRVLLAALSPSELDDYFARARLTAFTDRTLRHREALCEELDVVREQGWSLVDRELTEDLTSVAAPVYRNGQVVGAINVSFSDLDYQPAITDARPMLLRCATKIGNDLSDS